MNETQAMDAAQSIVTLIRAMLINHDDPANSVTLNMYIEQVRDALMRGTATQGVNFVERYIGTHAKISGDRTMNIGDENTFPATIMGYDDQSPVIISYADYQRIKATLGGGK